MTNNPSEWLEIKLETTPQFDNNSLEEALFAAGALSVTITSKADEAILIEPSPGELPLWEQGMIVTGLFEQGFDYHQAIPILQSCLATDNLPLLDTIHLADKRWELEWTKHFHPIQFGEHLWICPSYQTVPAEQTSQQTQIITLDPGLAFGTGTHPTTAMALEYIATHHWHDKHVIDYGCGSGVLGIAALKMGAKHCLMTDIDPQALITTAENADINHCSASISCYLPNDMPEIKTDFIIANILLTPLLSLKDTFVSLCHADTHILLTGLLNEQVDDIIKHYQHDFGTFKITSKDDWSMITATSKQA